MYCLDNRLVAVKDKKIGLHIMLPSSIGLEYLSDANAYQQAVTLSNLRYEGFEASAPVSVSSTTASSYFEFNRSINRIFSNNQLVPPLSTNYKTLVYRGAIDDRNVHIPVEWLSVCVSINTTLSADLVKQFNIVIPCMQINLYKLEMTRKMFVFMNSASDDATVVDFIIRLTSLEKGLCTPTSFANFCLMLASPPNWSFIEVIIRNTEICVLLKNQIRSVMYNTNCVNKSFFIFDYRENIITLYYGKQMYNEFKSVM